MAMSVYHLSYRRLKKVVKKTSKGNLDKWGKPFVKYEANFNSKYGELKITVRPDYPGTWVLIEFPEIHDFIQLKYLSIEIDELEKMRYSSFQSKDEKQYVIPNNIICYMLKKVEGYI